MPDTQNPRTGRDPGALLPLGQHRCRHSLMRGPHNIIRLIRTGATLERTGAMDVVLDAFEAPKALRFVARALGKPFQWLGYKGDPSMPPATRALTALGPAYIKFGQVLSTPARRRRR